MLYVFGPGVGPTILYWGELLLFVGVAWLLGRHPPDAAHDARLVAAGSRTVDVLVAGAQCLHCVRRRFQWRTRSAAPPTPGASICCRSAQDAWLSSRCWPSSPAVRRDCLRIRTCASFRTAGLRSSVVCRPKRRNASLGPGCCGVAVVVQDRDAGLGTVAVVCVDTLDQVGLGGSPATACGKRLQRSPRRRRPTRRPHPEVGDEPRAGCSSISAAPSHPRVARRPPPRCCPRACSESAMRCHALRLRRWITGAERERPAAHAVGLLRVCGTQAHPPELPIRGGGSDSPPARSAARARWWHSGLPERRLGLAVRLCDQRTRRGAQVEPGAGVEGCSGGAG